MTSVLSFISHSPRETQEMGQRLGELAQPGDVILLVGGLGTGKTCLVQGLATGLAIEEYVLSPTFVLVRQYQGRLTLYHIDLYRLQVGAEVEELGLDDYFYGDGVAVVEWADRALALMPPERLLIEMKILSPRKRHLTLKPQGRRYQELAQSWLSAL